MQPLNRFSFPQCSLHVLDCLSLVHMRARSSSWAKQVQISGAPHSATSLHDKSQYEGATLIFEAMGACRDAHATGVVPQQRKWGRHTKEQRAALLDLAIRFEWTPSAVPDDVMESFCTKQKVDKVRCPMQAPALEVRCRCSATSARVLAAVTHVKCAHRSA